MVSDFCWDFHSFISLGKVNILTLKHVLLNLSFEALWIHGYFCSHFFILFCVLMCPFPFDDVLDFVFEKWFVGHPEGKDAVTVLWDRSTHSSPLGAFGLCRPEGPQPGPRNWNDSQMSWGPTSSLSDSPWNLQPRPRAVGGAGHSLSPPS